MNLHGLVRGAITAVNPDIVATVRRQTGRYVTAEDGARTPEYQTVSGVRVQAQPVSGKDLQHLDALNIQGQMKSLHVNGDWQGVLRPKGKGGDVFIFDGSEWLVVQVMETWPDWCRVIVCRQMDAKA